MEITGDLVTSGDASRSSLEKARRWLAIKGNVRCLGIFSCLLAFTLPLQAQGPRDRRPANADPLPTLLRAADEALKEADFATAAKALRSALEIQPDMTSAWFNLAFAYSGLHQDEDAVHAYEKTLELQPNLFEARLNLGILLDRMKRPEAAVDHLGKAVALKPDNARAHLYNGEALSLTSNPEAAEAQFREAVRLDPSLATASHELGQLYLGQKRYAEARSAFEQAVRSDSKLAQANLGIALASEGLNDLNEAASHFERYLIAIPEDLETRFHLARVYLQQGNNDKALESLQTVYRGKPDKPGLAAALGDVCALMKKFPQSEKYYRQAVIETPAEPDLHRALGQTLLDQEKFSDAAAEFRAALKLDAKNREAAKGLATSFYLEKRYDEAVPLLEALARAPAPPAILFFELASCYDHLRDLPKAVDSYERFLELSHAQMPDQEWQARQRLKLLRRELRK